MRRRERQGRRNGAAILHKSKRNSTTLLGRPPNNVNLHRRVQSPACRLSVSLHRPRAQVESSVATSFATNSVREKAGSAELRRDENVARRCGSVLYGLTRRRRIATWEADLGSQSGHHNFDGQVLNRLTTECALPGAWTSSARPRRSSSTSLLGSEVPE